MRMTYMKPQQRNLRKIIPSKKSVKIQINSWMYPKRTLTAEWKEESIHDVKIEVNKNIETLKENQA